ncbi:uncharacterized protein BBA_03673 [Beauveria bassiana ARSEF 2860]|uniref:Uncharacterized protein n=1 Tax=Beauveria bassiana (strain ARSEF 2860) TaxID=655819 RepID=J4KPA2_BEAB2|nr:uncharacterized protein BBA_03673 [Beauveria bassiana ARSEF 2860]EJP67099.1 hypothetical protein BBA_03673 [Beauveria bassiana ARSEF 2860]
MSAPLAFLIDDDDFDLAADDVWTADDFDASGESSPRCEGSPPRDLPVASDVTWGEGHAALRPHTQIHRRCGTCQMPFRQYDRMLAITRRGGRLQVYDAQTATARPFAKQWYKVKATFCKLPGCSTCQMSHESATVHVDCFKLFVKECTAPDKIHRLWLASIVMDPWLQCRDTALPYNFQERMSSEDAARAWGMPLAARLPPEICLVILGKTRDTLFTKYIAVMSRARELSEAASPSQPPVSMSLNDIRYWSRGMAWPMQMEEQTEDELIRITIDSSGIQRIERLDKIGDPMHSTHLRKLFVVEESYKLELVKASLFGGHCRLTVPDHVNLILWDNPMPLKLYASLRLPQDHEFRRFSSIDTANCFGLTFFFHVGHIVAVHPHLKTSWDRDARRTFETLPLMHQKAVLWIYVPFPAGEELRGYCLRNRKTKEDDQDIGPCLALYMRQQGIIEIGYRYPLAEEYTICRTKNRPFLIHNIRTGYLRPHPQMIEQEQLSGVAVGATYPGHFQRKTAEPSAQGRMDRLLRPLRYEVYSTARLEMVRLAVVYNDPLTHCCRGIMFYYDCGKRRAVGECRIGVDVARSCANPTHFMYAEKEYILPDSRTRYEGTVLEMVDDVNRAYARNPVINSISAAWRPAAMSGRLEFRFAFGSTNIRVYRE